MNYQLFFGVIYKKARYLKQEELVSGEILYDIMDGLDVPIFSIWEV